MRKFTPRDLTIAALIAALYTVMGYFGNVFGLTFGPIQFRFAEALTVLPFLFPAAAPGLAVGCLITNLLSPYGPVDVIFGTLATAIAACKVSYAIHRVGDHAVHTGLDTNVDKLHGLHIYSEGIPQVVISTKENTVNDFHKIQVQSFFGISQCVIVGSIYMF